MGTREESFEPLLVPKGRRRLAGLDEKIIGLYARGMTMRQIRGFLEEQYGVEVSPELISMVTDSVMEMVQEWQNRPLDRVYPIVIFDALWVKMKQEGAVPEQKATAQQPWSGVAPGLFPPSRLWSDAAPGP